MGKVTFCRLRMRTVVRRFIAVDIQHGDFPYRTGYPSPAKSVSKQKKIWPFTLTFHFHRTPRSSLSNAGFRPTKPSAAWRMRSCCRSSLRCGTRSSHGGPEDTPLRQPLRGPPPPLVREELDLPQKMARLKLWCTDATAAEEIKQRYDFVFVDQAGFEKHTPGTFAALAASFTEYKNRP